MPVENKYNGYPEMKPIYSWSLGVFALALLLNIGVALGLGMKKAMDSDALQYLRIAQNLAAGKGYVTDATFWPGQPTMQRLPGWPAVIAVALRIVPKLDPDIVMRLTCLLCNAAIAGLLVLVAWQLWARLLPAVLAGLLYAIHPVALFLAYYGSSEMLFLVLVCAGLLAWSHSQRWRPVACLLFGAACLERANFLLWLPLAGVILGIYIARGKIIYHRGLLVRGALCAFLFLVPAILWMVRNHAVSGHFPVMSTLRGQTFYGGNNPVVADEWKYWGYWVFPDQIPGEKRLAELAQSGFSEYDADVYYFRKGDAYIRAHLFEMPRLWFGKLVRAYVPVPWKPAWNTYVAGAFRLVVYAGLAWGLMLGWRQVAPGIRLAFIAMAFANVVTVVVFWGYARFAFALEPFYLPFVGLAAARVIEEWRMEG